MSATDPAAFAEPSTRRDFLRVAAGGVLAAGVASNALGAIPLAPPDKQPPKLEIPGPPEKRVGYAIVGLGQLALEEVLPAFALCENSRPVALVSGHRDKAERVAAHYGIESRAIYDYQNFESIRDNPDVQAVYVILPNSMHAEFTERAFAAGKHVLCEKPMAVTPQDCRRMIDAGRKANRKLMIAYRLRYEPFNQSMIEMARKQAFGAVRTIEAQNLQTTNAPNIRLSRDLGGGPLGDVGIYCLNACRYVTGEEPVEVSAVAWADPADERFREVQQQVLFTLRFPSGVLAQCAAGFAHARSDRFRVVAADGWFQLDPAFGYVGQELTTKSKGSESKLTLTHVNHFAKEMDHFSECIRNDKAPRTPGEEGLADVRVMAAVQRAAAEGRTVKVSDVTSGSITTT